MFTTGGYCFVKVINQRPMFFLSRWGSSTRHNSARCGKDLDNVGQGKTLDCCLISLSPDASQMESKVNKQTALM